MGRCPSIETALLFVSRRPDHDLAKHHQRVRIVALTRNQIRESDRPSSAATIHHLDWNPDYLGFSPYLPDLTRRLVPTPAGVGRGEKRDRSRGIT